MKELIMKSLIMSFDHEMYDHEAFDSIIDFLVKNIQKLAAEIHGLAAEIAGQHFWGKRNAEY